MLFFCGDFAAEQRSIVNYTAERQDERFGFQYLLKANYFFIAKNKEITSPY